MDRITGTELALKKLQQFSKNCLYLTQIMTETYNPYFQENKPIRIFLNKYLFIYLFIYSVCIVVLSTLGLWL